MRTLNELKDYFENQLETKFNNDLTNMIRSLSRTKVILNEVTEVTKHLDRFFKLSKKVPRAPFSYRLYCIMNDIHTENDIPMCKCGKPCGFKSATEGFNISCGNKKCYQSLKEVNAKRQKTAKKNFGSLKSAYHDTAKKTIKKKYGVDNISQFEDIKQKKIETSRKNWGTDYPWQSEAGKQLQKDGVYKKYGVENVSQDLDIRTKITESNSDEYETPDGKIVNVQGSETFILNYLYKNYGSHIITPQPKIRLSYYDENGINHYWFPDIMITDSKNNNSKWLIEVKHFELLHFEKNRNIRYEIKSGIDNGYNAFVIITNEKYICSLSLINYETNCWKLNPLHDVSDKNLNYIKRKLNEYNFKLVEEKEKLTA